MNRWLLLPLLLAPLVGLAQSDPEFIPYDDPPTPPEDLPSRTYDPGLVDDHLYPETSRSFTRLDDPNTGLAFEAVGGLFFGDNAHRRSSDFRFTGGLRATWEVGRLFGVPPWQDGLVLDGTWWASGRSDGTAFISTKEALHLFTIAPAWHFPLGEGTPWTAFLQAGAGIAYQTGAVITDGIETPVSGVRPLIQYGLGLRARPQIGERLHMTIRVELMRFRRGYLDDTWAGFSMGLAF